MRLIIAHVLKCIIGGGNNVCLSTVRNIEPLHCLRKMIRGYLPLPYIEYPHTPIHTGAKYLRAMHLHLRDRILEAFDDFDGVIGLTAIIPAAHSGIVRSANLEYTAKYNHIVLLVEGDAVDPRSMPGVLANILALDDISEYDILIAAASDELGVVLADVEGVDVVVVDVAVVLDEQVPRGVV